MNYSASAASSAALSADDHTPLNVPWIHFSRATQTECRWW